MDGWADGWGANVGVRDEFGLGIKMESELTRYPRSFPLTCSDLFDIGFSDCLAVCCSRIGYRRGRSTTEKGKGKRDARGK